MEQNGGIERGMEKEKGKEKKTKKQKKEKRKIEWMGDM
jgi:hypothetical protein